MRRVVVLAVGLLFSVFIQAAESEFQRWKRESLQHYQNYRSEQDAAFGSYLARQWQEFKLFKGEKRDPVPKPQIPPSAPVTEKPVVPPRPAAKKPPLPIPPTTPAAPGKPPAPVLPQTTIKPSVLRNEVNVGYFGSTVQLPTNTIPSFPADAVPSNDSISGWWQRAANGDHSLLLEGVRTQVQKASLSDWATFQLLKRYGDAIYPTDRNSRVAMIWFVLTRLGYATKMAYTDGQLVLLLRTVEPLYETLYLESAGQRYYVVDTPSGASDRLHSYQGSHPDATTAMSMAQDLQMFDGSEVTTRRNLNFPYAGKNYHVTIDYQKAIIDYLNTIPPTELTVYFNAHEAASLRTQLASQLKPLTAGLTKEKSVNLLLAFVQHAFPYATDEQQFGREHYMFADEIFHYPSSDCEDRAVLFAHLVRELLALDVVGVSYPGHVAAAVQLPGGAGRRFTHNNREYVIADPTYINATVGMEMPQYRDVTPHLIGKM